MNPTSLSKTKGSLKYIKPKINCAVGVKKNIILAGPIPTILKPIVYKNKGTKVIIQPKINKKTVMALSQKKYLDYFSLNK